jgi:hypothetical protein
LENLYFNENIDDVNTCIKSLFNSNEAFIILEKIDDFKFTFYDGGDITNNWEKGRVFNKSGELKWKRIGKNIHVVYIGEDVPTQLKKAEDVQFHDGETKEETFILRGKLIKDEDRQYFNEDRSRKLFVEMSTPVLLEYPVNGKNDYAAIRTRNYLDLLGNIQFSRFISVNDLEVYSNESL